MTVIAELALIAMGCHNAALIDVPLQTTLTV
jgi:hypothetical protein